MIVTDATPEDVPALVRLVNTAYRTPGDTPGWTDERDLIAGGRTDVATTTEELSTGRILVLRPEVGGPVVACVRVAAQGETWTLGSLAVDPARQATGLGAALLAEVERQARQAGVRSLRMTVISQRTTLIAWYERRGYQRTGATVPFPYDDPRVGRPLRDDLSLAVLEKVLERGAAGDALVPPS